MPNYMTYHIICTQGNTYLSLSLSLSIYIYIHMLTQHSVCICVYIYIYYNTTHYLHITYGITITR